MKKILILFVFLLMSTNSVSAYFDDLEEPNRTSAYEEGIYYLQDEEIFNGYDYYLTCLEDKYLMTQEEYDSLNENEILDTCRKENWFSPGSPINRAEFLKIVMMASGHNSEGSNCYPDVKDEWFAPFVCAATELGIVDGYDDGNFKPGNEINFVEASKIIVNAYEMELPEKEGTDWYEPYVKALEGVNAIPGGINRLDQEMFRDISAEMIYRLHLGVEDKWSHSYEGMKALWDYIEYLDDWDLSLLSSAVDYEEKLSALADEYEIPVYESDLVEGVDEQTIEELKLLVAVYMPHDSAENYVYYTNYNGVVLFLAPFIGEYNISDEMDLGEISYSEEIPEILDPKENSLMFEIDLDGDEVMEVVRLNTNWKSYDWSERTVEVFTKIDNTWVNVLTEDIDGNYTEFWDIGFAVEALTLDASDQQVLKIKKGNDRDELDKRDYIFGYFDGLYSKKSLDVADGAEGYCIDYDQMYLGTDYYDSEGEHIFEDFVDFYRITLNCSYSVVFDRKNFEGGMEWEASEGYEVYLEESYFRERTYLFDLEEDFMEIDEEETWGFEVVEDGVVRMYKDDWEYYISLGEKVLLTDY
jgi:S-layer homology domain